MILTIQTPAVDRKLVDLDEAKAALGITGDTADDAITALILRVSDAISRHCRVAAAGADIPTLRSETLVETMFLPGVRSSITLARRFVTAVEGVEPDSGAAIVDGAAGVIYCDPAGQWAAGRIAITYTAGFVTVPDDLKLACLTALREQWAAAVQDPLVKRTRVEDVAEVEYWVGGLAKAGQGPFSLQVGEMLAPYRTPTVA